MEKKAEQAKASLERRFGQLKDAKNRKDFFFNLVDYLRYVDGEPTFGEATKQLLNMAEEEFGRLLGPSFPLTKGVIETSRKAQTLQETISSGLFGRRIKPQPLEKFVPIGMAALVHSSTNFQLAKEMETTPWGAAIHLAKIPTLVDELITSKEDSEKRLNMDKWRRYTTTYHNYLLDYLGDFSRKGRCLKAGKLRFWLDGRIEIEGSEEKVKLDPKTQSYELLRTLIERHNDDPKAWLRPEEAWKVVYGHKKKAGKWERRLQSGPYRNIKKALVKITDVELIEIKSNAIKIKA